MLATVQVTHPIEYSSGTGPAGSTLSTYASRRSGFPLRFIVASSAGAVFITNGRRAGR